MRSKDPFSLRITDLWSFKSNKSNKRYIVEVEHISNHFLGLKFFWKGVADSKDRYSIMAIFQSRCWKMKYQSYMKAIIRLCLLNKFNE